jgi:hypothetical protein
VSRFTHNTYPYVEISVDPVHRTPYAVVHLSSRHRANVRPFFCPMGKRTIVAAVRLVRLFHTTVASRFGYVDRWGDFIAVDIQQERRTRRKNIAGLIDLVQEAGLELPIGR